MTEKAYNLARDLLPLYVEGKVSEDSARFVKRCMEENEELREMYVDMCSEIELTAESPMTFVGGGSHAMRKKRWRIPKWTLPFVLFILGYGGALWGIIVYLFHILSRGVL